MVGPGVKEEKCRVKFSRIQSLDSEELDELLDFGGAHELWRYPRWLRWSLQGAKGLKCRI